MSARLEVRAYNEYTVRGRAPIAASSNPAKGDGTFVAAFPSGVPPFKRYVHATISQVARDAMLRCFPGQAKCPRLTVLVTQSFADRRGGILLPWKSRVEAGTMQ